MSFEKLDCQLELSKAIGEITFYEYMNYIRCIEKYRKKDKRRKREIKKAIYTNNSFFTF